MTLTALAFYLFATVSVASAFMVISARNPVYSVLFLILTFFNSAGLFVLMGAEFLAMILVVVYVGAVAVLFLFVVMMLDINYQSMQEGFRRHLPLGLIIGAVLLIELVVLFSGPETTLGVAATSGERSNVALIGDVLYTDHIYVFQLAGLILLVAMIGAITLTMRHREGVKRQNIALQNARTREESVTVMQVESDVAPQSILPDETKSRKALR